MGLWGAGVPRWSKKKYFQTWSCGISNWRGWRAEQNASKIFILGSNWWPWGEVKGQISLNSSYHVNFKDFYTKLCVCSHKWKIQNISDRIFILLPGSCPRGGILGHWGAQGVKIFFQTWSCGISNQRGWRAEQNANKIFILGSNWWPWGKVKRSNIINMSISRIFIPNSLCVFPQIKDRKHIEQNFHSVARVMPRVGLVGAEGVKNFSVGICDGAPSTVRSSDILLSRYLEKYNCYELQTWSGNQSSH